jgi:transcriptional regulator with XRE-family HTH domain
MKSPLRISRILTVEPFKIIALWGNAQIRIIDFEPLFDEWEKSGQDTLLELTEFENFSQVELSESKTLAWPNIKTRFEFDGQMIDAPLDLDPDVLLSKSELIDSFEPLSIGNMLKTAREAQGLTQADVAERSGTTRHYISKIESGKSDLQLETFHRIVELGLGKRLVLTLEDKSPSRPYALVPRNVEGRQANFYSLNEPMASYSSNPIPETDRSEQASSVDRQSKKRIKKSKA